MVWTNKRLMTGGTAGRNEQKMEIPVGATHTERVTVTRENTASAFGSGLVDVFATPMMVALLESAAARCIQPYLEEGFVSVGTCVDVEHTGATPIGMQVTATATVTLVDRRRVEFTVQVADDCGEVGRGTHTRFVVDKVKFTDKANAKHSG